MTAGARLRLVAGVLALGCGNARNLVGAAPPDAAADETSTPDAPALPFIEVDCTPSIAEIGRFSPQCQLTEVFFDGAPSGAPAVRCERIADAGGWVGTIVVTIRHPEEIALGQPLIVGGSDPGISVDVSSGSVIMDLVQNVPDSAAGAIVIDAFEPGRQMRGRFVDVTFSRYPRPPTYPCRISNSGFVAQPPGP